MIKQEKNIVTGKDSLFSSDGKRVAFSRCLSKWFVNFKLFIINRPTNINRSDL